MQIGPYDVLDVLGRGGMGVVFRVRHRELGVERALKLLSGTWVSRRAARFEREAMTLARIQHPGVVRINEAGLDPQGFYFVMDLVEGEPLATLLRRGALPPERALELSRSLAEAVAALHAQGLVHRDLKPENVIVRPDGSPVLIDFGIALDEGEVERLTQTGALVGTLHYMAPEQLTASRDAVGPHTDVYALGLVIYELFTGRAALQSDTTVAKLAEQISQGIDVRTRRIDASLPPALDRLLARACAPAPEERFADAAQLAAALQELELTPPRRAPLGIGLLALAGSCALLAFALLRSGAEGQALAPTPTSTPGASPPTPAATPSLAQLTPEEERLASDELRELARRSARERLADLARWRRRYPSHPQSERAGELWDETLRGAPRQILRYPKLKAGIVTELEWWGKRLVAMSDSGARALNLDPEAKKPRFERLTKQRAAMASSGAGRLWLGVGSRLWRLEPDGSRGFEVKLKRVSIFALAPRGETMAIFSAKGGVFLYHLETKRLRRLVKGGGPLEIGARIAFLADGSLIAIRRGQGAFKAGASLFQWWSSQQLAGWQKSKSELVPAFKVGQPGGVWALTPHPSRAEAAIGSTINLLVLFTPPDGLVKVIPSSDRGATFPVSTKSSVRWVGYGRGGKLYVISSDQQVDGAWIDAFDPSYERTWQVKLPKLSRVGALDAEARRLYVATEGDRIEVWQLQ